MLKYCWKVFKNGCGMYITALVLEILFYGGSFLLNGLIRRDIFNVLEGIPAVFNINLWLMVVLVGLAPTVVSIIKQVNAYLVTISCVRFNNKIKDDLYYNMIHIPSVTKHNISSNESISRYRDDVEDMVRFLEQFIDLLPKLIMSIAAILILFKINLIFTLISLFPLAIIVCLSKLLQNKILAYRKNNRIATGTTVKFIGDVFNTIECIKVSPSKNALFHKFQIICEKRGEETVRDRCLETILNVVSSGIMDMILGVILLLSGIRIFSGRFSIGDFTIFQYYFFFLAMLPSIVSGLFKSYFQSKVAFQRLMESTDGKIVVSRKYKKKDAEFRLPQGQGDVIIKRMNYVSLPNELSFRINVGEIAVVSGKTGKGKTMFLRGLVGELGDECRLEYRHGNTVEENVVFAPPDVCYVPQRNVLFKDTLMNNICMGKTVDLQLVDKVLRLVSFENDLLQLDNGLQTIIGSGGAKLSGGQRKRIALARALYMEPCILVLDDFSAGLDIKTRNIIQERLIFSGKYTFILSSNEIDILNASSVIINLDERQVQYAGLS